MIPEEDRNRKRDSRTPTTPAPPPLRADQLPVKPGDPCSPVAEPTALTFYTPEGCPIPAATPPAIPSPLVFSNVEVTKTCADGGQGPIGNPVTIPAGRHNITVHFTDIAGVTPDQLTFISTFSELSLREIAGTSVSNIANTLKLTQSQATEWRLKCDLAAAGVAARATASALGALDCWWENDEFTFECGEFALTSATPGTEHLVNNPAVVPAGTIISRLSQNDANDAAAAKVVSEVKCLWANTAQTADCVSSYDLEEEVPVDETIVGAASRRRVGSFTVAAGSVFSQISQEDADAIAMVQAVSSLDCFYLNTSVTRTCAKDLDDVDADILPETGGSSAVTGIPGNPFYVPEGFITSEVSTEAANEEALAYALSNLRCEWSNDEVTVVCPTDTVGEVVYDPSELSPISSVTLPAGVVFSEVSKAAANAEAEIQAALGLDCLYCNKPVEPKCPLPGYTVVTLPVPLEDTNSNWSLNATLGVDAGAYCASTAEEAQQLADIVADVPIPTASVTSECQYGNHPIEASCTGDPEDSVVLATPDLTVVERGGPCVDGDEGTAGGSFLLPFTLPTGNDPIKIAKFDPEDGLLLSSLSWPNPFSPEPAKRVLTIGRDTIQISESQVPTGYAVGEENRAQLYANELAAVLAVGSLDCFFSNCAAYYLCEGEINLRNYTPTLSGDVDGIPVYGDGTMISREDAEPYEVAEISVGSTAAPLYVSEGQFSSYVSYADMQTQLTTYLLTALRCVWANTAIEVLCGATLVPTEGGYTYTPGDGTINSESVDADSTGSVTNPVVVSAGQEESDYSPERAQFKALLPAVAALNCFFTNEEQTANCPAALSDTFDSSATSTFTVPANYFPSNYSRTLANLAALQMATASLRCVYASREVTILDGDGDTIVDPCGETDTRKGPDSLDAGSEQSLLSSDDATNKAKVRLSSMQQCFGDGELGGATGDQGLPGNDGAQVDCEGNCLGFFS